MQNLHDDRSRGAGRNQVSLNYHRANLSAMKQFYKEYDEQNDSKMSYEDFSKLMQNSLIELYSECKVPNCGCKANFHDFNPMKFEKRFKNQYELLVAPLTKDENGELPGGSRVVWDHENNMIKTKLPKESSFKHNKVKFCDLFEPETMRLKDINEGFEAAEQELDFDKIGLGERKKLTAKRKITRIEPTQQDEKIIEQPRREWKVSGTESELKEFLRAAILPDKIDEITDYLFNPDQGWLWGTPFPPKNSPPKPPNPHF